MDTYGKKGIEAALAGIAEVTFSETTDSTNRQAAEYAQKAHAPHLFAARAQTAGRGRLGRAFFSEGGIYMSLFLPAENVSIPPVLLTTAAASAVARAIETQTGESVQIKWINDIYRQGKKLCGILSQAVYHSEQEKTTGYVIGIGINVAPVQFPLELAEIATALPEQTDKNALVAEIVRCLLKAVKEAPSSIVAYAKEKSCVLGRKVRCFSADGLISETGTAVDISPEGFLLVETENEKKLCLSGGEISLRFTD